MRSRFVLLLILLVPAPLAAQMETVGIPNAAITLFTGARTPFTTGYITAFGPDGQPVLQLREERQAGALLGLDGEFGVGGPLRFLVGGSYSQMGRGVFMSDRDPETGEQEGFTVIYGGATWFAKAGLSYRLQSQPTLTDNRRRAATDFFVAPAIVHEMDATHPAVNFGFKGAFPVGTSNVEVMVGVEDYMVFWRHSELETPIRDIFGGFSNADSIEFLYDTSNRLLLRLGATLRL
jgi:hypothetical protein